MRIIYSLFAVIICTFTGSAVAFGLNVDPVYGIVGMNGIGVAMSFVKIGGIRAGVYVEVWTGELVKQFSHADTATFLDGLPDYSRYVENDIIHLVEIGVDPEVLINNTTYPIPIVDLDDEDIPIKLDKFTTKTTPITDDELFALSYDKIASVRERHGNSLIESKHDKAIHAIAPTSHTALTPVITTSGEDDGFGRARLIGKDIVNLKKAFDDAKVPKKDRRLVLSNDHVNDLLLEDPKFEKQYSEHESGVISKKYGFTIYEYVSNPFYSEVGVKKAFGSIEGENEYQASVAFYAKRMFKASGTTKMYYSEAKTDPDNHKNKINFETRHIVLPTKLEAIGAIYSGQAEAVA